MRRALNRVLVALVGLVLLVLGGAALIGGCKLPERLGWLNLPGWWPWPGPHRVLLKASDRTRWVSESWWWPVAIAALALLLLLSLWWLLAQLRRRTLQRVAVADAPWDENGVRLRGRALAEVIAEEAEQLPGVDRARARMRGRATRPRARLELWLTLEAEPRWVMRLLHEQTLAHARASAGLTDLTSHVRLHGPGPSRGRHLD